MRPAAKLAAAALGALAVSMAHAEAQDIKGQPFELVRALQSLQDQVVRGNARAHAAQPGLLAQIGDQFDNLSDEGWREPKNARAALVFVLSGGNARVLESLLRSGGAKLLPEPLVRGALAFGLGQAAEAWDMLSAVDARSLDPGIAGHVAYVQGELASKKDARRAAAYFEDARLLSPGTIIEEAALRRQIALPASSGDMDRYMLLAAQYLRRFPQSVYAAAFKQEFASVVARTSLTGASRLARLEVLLGGVEQAERSAIYLAIAKDAAERANIEVATFAAHQAVRMAASGSAEKERALLYEGAALIVTDKFDEGLARLNALDVSKLPEADRALREAALSIAAQVRRPPAAAPAAAPQREAAQPSVGYERAQRAIALVDDLLAGAGAR